MTYFNILINDDASTRSGTKSVRKGYSATDTVVEPFSHYRLAVAFRGTSFVNTHYFAVNLARSKEFERRLFSHSCFLLCLSNAVLTFVYPKV